MSPKSVKMPPRKKSYFTNSTGRVLGSGKIVKPRYSGPPKAKHHLSSQDDDYVPPVDKDEHLGNDDEMDITEGKGNKGGDVEKGKGKIKTNKTTGDAGDEEVIEEGKALQVDKHLFEAMRMRNGKKIHKGYVLGDGKA